VVVATLPDVAPTVELPAATDGRSIWLDGDVSAGGYGTYPSVIPSVVALDAEGRVVTEISEPL